MSHTFKKIKNNTFQRAATLNSYCYWENAFSDEEIQKITEILDKRELEKGLTGTGKGEESSARISDVRFFAPDEETFLIFDRLNYIIDEINTDFFNFDLNGYDSIQYTVYNAKNHGKYDFHTDVGFDSSNKDFESYIGMRKISIVVLLSDPEKDFTGGQFQINIGCEKDARNILLKKGMLIAFPSFVVHRVLPVFSGIRKTLVTWVLGPKFR